MDYNAQQLCINKMNCGGLNILDDSLSLYKKRQRRGLSPPQAGENQVYRIILRFLAKTK